MKIQKKILIHIPRGQKKTRIDKYLASHIENSSRTKIQKAIESGFVLVNSKIVKPNYLVLPDDFIDIELPYLPDKADILPENIPLDILFEDKYLMIVNKPPGMVTHPAYKNYSGTLVNALMYYMKISKNDAINGSEKSSGLSSLYGLERAGIVHRLDKDTSGLLVVAKNEEVHRKLSLLFSKHRVEREYWALVWGLFKIKNGVIEKPLGRSHKDRKKVVVVKEGKSAVTEYEVIKEFNFLSLVKLKLKTGRTHQIRVHMHSTGHPVFGDPSYDGRKPHGVQLTVVLNEQIKILLNKMPRQTLHAKVLGFIHPVTNEKLRFESELPHDFKSLLDTLK